MLKSAERVKNGRKTLKIEQNMHQNFKNYRAGALKNLKLSAAALTCTAALFTALPSPALAADCLTAADVKAELTVRLDNLQTLSAEITALFTLDEDKSKLLKTFLDDLLSDVKVRELIAAELPTEDKKCLTEDEEQRIVHKLYSMILSPSSQAAASGLLRITAPERKRLMIYNLSRAELLDSESCSAYLSGKGQVDGRADLKAMQDFFTGINYQAMEEYLGLMGAALKSQAAKSPELNLLSAKDSALGQIMYSRALDKWREMNTEASAKIGQILQQGEQASAEDRCYLGKTFMLIMLSLKGETGDLVLLSALQQSSPYRHLPPQHQHPQPQSQQPILPPLKQ